MPVPFDESLRDLLGCGVATVLGTRDADLVPEVTRGWGVHVLPDSATLEVCVGLPSGARTLRNIADNGLIAVTCVRPSDYRQVQLKGRVAATAAPTPGDRERVRRHREAFREQVAQVGIARELCDGFWSHDDPEAMVKLSVEVEDGFDQTPGPDAGRPL